MTSRDYRKPLLYALRCVLRPIIRILIRAGVRFDEFSELARGVYVESAIRDGIEHVGTLSRDRIVMATGVARQQVDFYIENEAALPVAQPTLVRVAVEVLHKWHKDSKYQASDGTPFDLKFESPSERSLSELIRQVDPTVAPGIVLEELLRAGAINCPDDMHFRPLSRSLIPPETHMYRIECFGAALGRLAETLEYNFNPRNSENKRLERFVAVDKGLPCQVLAEFESYAKQRADQLLKDLDDWLAPYGDPVTSGFGPRIGTGVHVFLFLDPLSTVEEPLSGLVQGHRTWVGFES
ncbi:MAG TPA: DUF6502 family protein [Steroidobacteraceae bacterium]|jgi:hypothetical protein|nr:DUF6502 family protein [Steroidobacteraceae bacterium]